MEQYNITGMSCAACSARIEKAVSAVEGVTSCSVSLLTNSMGVSGTADSLAIIKAVENAGYGASLKGQTDAKSKSVSLDELEDRDTPALKRRLLYSIGFLLVLMYFSMGHMMLSLPIPKFFDGNPVALGLIELILAAIVMIINQKFFISGFKGLIKRSPNMDTLVALGSFASFVYSTYSLFAMTKAPDMDTAMGYMNGFYFESAAMILTLITVGKMLEARSKGKTTDALKGLIALTPKTATIIVDGKEIKVAADDVKPGDVFTVRPGESIPVDAIISEGNAAIDESALTGESIPVDKFPGDSVSAATINKSGFLRCTATRTGENTTLAQIIKTVSDAAATKAPIAKVADKVSGIFVPAVIGIAVLTTVIWLLIDHNIGHALSRGIAVLVISCPCSLGLATPVAVMVGNGVGAKNGILFKNAVTLENAGKTQIVALDKTGTITKGEPTVTDIKTFSGFTDDELIAYAYSIEKLSEHPLAKAVVQKAEEMNAEAYELTDFTALPGNGLRAVLQGSELLCGSLTYIEKQITLDDSTREFAKTLAFSGKTPLFFVFNKRLAGIIAVADTLKDDSISAISEMKNMGMRVVMLTGDNKLTADAIGKAAGVDEVIAGVLPDEKAKVVSRLKSSGRVAMVGDGINDAPALTSADIGIAIGAGTDIAIDAASIVLMNSKLSDVSAAIRLSRRTLTNIHENLFWAFLYNSIGIPVAAGAFAKLLSLELSPMLAALAMSLSSFCVVTNALRLNLINIHSSKHDKKVSLKNKSKAKERFVMEKTMKIEGMMCMHCENRVKNALLALPEVESVQVSHETGTAKVVLKSELSDDALKKAVEAQDYKVTEIK